VKAQILAGGRGKGVFDNGFKGGVHLCNTYAPAPPLLGAKIFFWLYTGRVVLGGRLHRVCGGCCLQQTSAPRRLRS
jgi:hypothetical protein